MIDDEDIYDTNDIYDDDGQTTDQILCHECRGMFEVPAGEDVPEKCPICGIRFDR
jgi:hypothetical protein